MGTGDQHLWGRWLHKWSTLAWFSGSTGRAGARESPPVLQVEGVGAVGANRPAHLEAQAPNRVAGPVLGLLRPVLA
jgi:hypothetical protein